MHEVLTRDDLDRYGAAGRRRLQAEEAAHGNIRDAGHVLMDDRIDRPRQQEGLGLFVEVVADHHDGLGYAGRLQRLRHAILPAADAIDAKQVGMGVDHLPDPGEVDLRIIVAVDHLEDLQLRVFVAQDSAKTNLALLVAAVELAAPHHRQLPWAPAKAPHEQAAGTAGRTIVDADVGQAIDASDVRPQREHRYAGTSELPHRLADNRVVDPLKRDAGAASLGTGQQPLGESSRVHPLDEGNVELRAASLACTSEGFTQDLGRASGIGGKKNVEVERGVCGTAARRPDARARHLAQCLLDPGGRLLPNTAARIQDAIDGCRADPSFGGDLCDPGPALEHALVPDLTNSCVRRLRALSRQRQLDLMEYHRNLLHHAPRY